MGDNNEDQERRRQQVQDAVERARSGAKRFAGWLGERLESAVEGARNTEVVRRKLSELSARRQQRERGRQEGSLEAIYDAWIEDLAEAIAAIEDRVAALDAAIAAVNENIGALQVRGVRDDNEEMRQYRAQIGEMRAERAALLDNLGPFRDELERMDRERRAALAQLKSEVHPLLELQLQAERQVRESKVRLGAELDESDQQTEHDET